MADCVKVFIDGAEGTTGLRLAQRLGGRADIELLAIDPALRKNAEARAACANAADVVFLCLPDAAAKEAVSWIDPAVRVIDASTAHRTDDGWAYGLPELSAAHRAGVEASNRVANPGCHATGLCVLAYPLVSAGILPPDYPVACHSVTGYSGGGKSMIAQYENPDRAACFNAPRQYAMGQTHKHQPEMQKVCGLAHTPIIHPIVADIYAGMVVTVPLHTRLLQKYKTPGDLHGFFADFYAGQTMIRVMPPGAESACAGGMIDAGALAGCDDLEIFVCGNDDRIALVARFDNLGKGASGAAIQNMNILCGWPEQTGLALSQPSAL